MDNSSTSLFGNRAKLGAFIRGMYTAYGRGENMMEYARKVAGNQANSPLATLLAYDLQAGTYVTYAREQAEAKGKWCQQLAAILSPMVERGDSLLEVGSGEATTLSGVLRGLADRPRQAYGFDISWSRCLHGKNWLREQAVDAELFVADLFDIPLADSSIDVVYTSHSLEPNGGRELEALRELLRIARRAVVLFEPIYELAAPAAQARMESHGYVRGLKEAAQRLGAKVVDYRLLGFTANPLNPSGVIVLEKFPSAARSSPTTTWRCPLTDAELAPHAGTYYAAATGIAYPVLDGIPLLCSNHAIIASALGRSLSST